MTSSQLRCSAIASAVWLWFAAAGVASAQADGGTDAGVEARLQELTQRLAEQERVNAQQQAEIDAHKARERQAATEESALAEASSTEWTASDESVEPSFRLYGFADTGLQRIWGGFFNTGLAQSDKLNFVLGNVNVYFDATPLEHFRMLTEVRFTTLPNGAESSDLVNGSTERESTAIFDPTSAAGGILTIFWGSILLERAQIEWNPVDWINLRVGYFLTPVGIWNIDHGSPTRIMLRPPLFMSAYLVPERQTGLELHGTVHLLPWELGYSAYVSNGRTFGSVDFSDDKALGGRLVLKALRPFPMQFGASIYYGTSQDYEKTAGVNAMGQAALVRHEIIALRELIAGADVSLDLAAFRIRAEVIARRLVYDAGKRELTFGVPNANELQSAGYLMVAYQLPWWGLEPLVMAEYLRQPTIQLGEFVVTGSAGLNIYFNPVLTFRLQYCYTKIVDVQETSRDHSDYDLHIFATRLILSY